MIIVNMYEDDETGLLEKFSVEGHAGYSSRGNDIVCAAVSALTIATINALQSRFTVDLHESEGFISCMIAKPDLASNLITRVFKEGIKAISEQYNENVKMHRHYIE